MNTATASDLSVANTILAQLGGSRFSAMTGAKHFMGDASSLSFQLPRSFARGGINAVRIALEADDTYTVEFRKVGTARSGYKCTVVSSTSMVYADQLRAVFTAATGLETSLGTLGGAR